MDLTEAIQQLKLEKKRIERAIEQLEKLQSSHVSDVGGSVKNTRGRKSMADEERREVSKRMKRYWAKRREPEPR
jgi:23S rRNA maturation-related 3'-5' exoribonuclease YhaM